ncbi:MAG: hypothetical protein AB7E47_14400 [Desulfovibrionaceae bacterium]
MMETNPQNAASVSEQVAALEAEAAELDATRKHCEQEVKRLRAAEDHAAGVSYAQEIFTMQQNKLRLEVEIDLLRKKARRMTCTW